jgi:hypothetical protein
MKYWVAPIVLAGFLAAEVFGEAKGPEIRVIDNKVSINAEAVPLGRLLQLLDRATGMQSKVPAGLANRNLSVRFADLSMDDAVRKIFEGQPLDYVVIERQGFVVIALSQSSGAEPSPAAVYNQASPQIEQQTFIEDHQGIQPAQAFPPQPGVVQGFAGAPGAGLPPGVPNSPFNQQQQPAVIQTPFGPIPNPRANQPVQPNMPGQAPGQANPFGAVAPFTGNNPFGAQQPPAGQNNTFMGNTSPPLFNQNQGQPAK